MRYRRAATRAAPILAAAAALTASAAAQKPDPPAEQAPAPQPAEAAATAPSVTGGYSWSNKPRKKKARRQAKRRIDPEKPLATYPGFALQPDGTSKIWLRVNKKVPVEVRRAAGRVVFVLRQVQVGIDNNTNPLVTTHFATAVASARLVAGKDGAQLVVELRDRVEPTHRVTEGPPGAMLLEVTVPRPTKTFADTVDPQRAPASGSGKVLLPGTATEKSTRGPRP